MNIERLTEKVKQRAKKGRTHEERIELLKDAKIIDSEGNVFYDSIGSAVITKSMFYDTLPEVGEIGAAVSIRKADPLSSSRKSTLTARGRLGSRKKKNVEEATLAHPSRIQMLLAQHKEN